MDGLLLSNGPPPTKTLKLEVTLDTVCPWSYIGLKELETAINLAENDHLPLKFDVEFKPYRLDPTLPPEGMDKHQLYLTKFGAERWTNISSFLKKRGQEVDINFDFDGRIRRTGNCHRVLRYAYLKQKAMQVNVPRRFDLQGRLASEIFKGFFERGEDTQDPENLARYCENVGLMTRLEALEFIRSNALSEHVENLIDDAKSNGITGVPHTVINSRWAIVGGQTADVFYKIFEKLAAA